MSNRDPETNKAKCKIYRETHREQVAATKKAWYEVHRDEQLVKRKSWHATNRDRSLALMKLAYRKNCKQRLAEQKIWRENHYDQVIAQRRSHYLKNRDRLLVQSKVYRNANPEKRKNSKLRYYFGIGIDEYNMILAQQNSVCAICRKTCKSGRQLAVDHDHVSGTVRGLLCSSCNIVIGHINDSQERIYQILEYLKQSTLRLAKTA